MVGLANRISSMKKNADEEEGLPVPDGFQFGKGIVPPVQVISDKDKEWHKGKMDGKPHEPAVPRDERESKNRSRECSRKCKTAKRPFQGRIERDLEQDEHCKPADNRDRPAVQLTGGSPPSSLLLSAVFILGITQSPK